jgi:beta-fructofuranosidase
MYSGSGYSDWEIGDIDVIIHESTYHLFHLIIPNHDYIAHATSHDGISWRRTKNALFVGHPGEWDDDMLWTMHVAKKPNGFCMYYTGLQRKDKGSVQKIGFAVSRDLVHWEKASNAEIPFGTSGPYYEDLANNPRGWLSFRDPFSFSHQGEEYLLICARSHSGPTSRRGCIGLAQRIEQQWALLPPLLFPMVYDDIECPCAFYLNDRYYILGSIREDIKVRYWFSNEFRGEYHSFRADVLLPQGNYAARVVKDKDHLLVYNFFYLHEQVNAYRVLPPPKQLETDPDGRLLLTSFYRWSEMKGASISQDQINPPKRILGNSTSELELSTDLWTFSCRSGYEIFCWEKPAESYIWEGKITVNGIGKFGLVTDMDHEGNGYFISFDITNKIVQIRTWGFNPADNHSNFIFKNIQSNIFNTLDPNSFDFKLIRYGRYIELSIEGEVKLTLIDYMYQGDLIGVYTASSSISIDHMRAYSLPSPKSEYGSQEETLADSQ